MTGASLCVQDGLFPSIVLLINRKQRESHARFECIYKYLLSRTKELYLRNQINQGPFRSNFQ
jgi:hypothetical protein